MQRSFLDSDVRTERELLCLSIRQAWAWAIAEGLKTLENRTWKTPYRGWLLLHAGVGRQSVAASLNYFDLIGYPRPAASELHFGAILGVGSLCEIGPRSQWPDDPFAEGPYCWRFDRVLKFRQPLPWRGQLSLFNVRLPQPVGSYLA